MDITDKMKRWQEEGIKDLPGKEIRIPTTVVDMGAILKKVCDDYKQESISLDEFEKQLKFLFLKRNDLFTAAVSDRWVGARRKKLIESVLI